MSTAPTTPEKYLVAFVIQGDTMFKITADNIIQATGGAAGLASFDGVAKLKAAAALVELTNQHNERPEELRQMAREMAGEGMRLLARAGAGGRVVVSSSTAQTSSSSSSQMALAPVPVEVNLA
jgi:hypothetical protein